jgi:cell division protein FtsL
MPKLLLAILLALLPACSQADNSQLLGELDAAIAKREQFIAEKTTRIDNLKQKVKDEKDSIAILKVIDKLFEEYYVFKFDSALAYANQGLSAAERQGHLHYQNLFNIHVAEILAIGGLYSEAIGHLNRVNTTNARQDILFKLYYTYFSVYSYWSDYCNDQLFAPQYRQKANEHLRHAMQYADEDDPLIRFYQGEQNVYVEPDSQQARTLYLNIIKTTDEKSRLYAMASFALAGNYRVSGNEEKYEEYLIKAALSDLKCCTMENLALQSLAVFLFQSNSSEIERAECYINVSMEDAKFYGNRLRILEISRILPQIMNAYQAAVEKQNRNLRYSVIFISLLVVGLLFTAYFIYRQNRKLNARRHELAESNQQLSDLNAQLAESNGQQAQLNSQLHELNERLVYTNKHRERLASIYIDLCAKYIDKLGKYQTLVKRKIKAHQEQELLQTISSTRISEEDAATFLNRFDKAFLELYPTFVEEFNALLTEEGRIAQKSPTTLTTELRTFALIRLGVKNTADIAGLLFLSNQTIYNCRSVIKNKAINKDTFDDDVMRLCTVIR